MPGPIRTGDPLLSIQHQITLTTSRLAGRTLSWASQPRRVKSLHSALFARLARYCPQLEDIHRLSDVHFISSFPYKGSLFVPRRLTETNAARDQIRRRPYGLWFTSSLGLRKSSAHLKGRCSIQAELQAQKPSLSLRSQRVWFF